MTNGGATGVAITTLERSPAAGAGQSDAYDRLFLDMAHDRLKHREEPRGCDDRAVLWLKEQKRLPAEQTQELTAFPAKAQAVLAVLTGQLPADIFAPPP